MQPASLKSVTFCSSASWLSSSEKSVAKPWDPQSFPKGGRGGADTHRKPTKNIQHLQICRKLNYQIWPFFGKTHSFYFNFPITSPHFQSLAVATAAPNHEQDTCSTKFSTEFGRSVTTVLPPERGIVGNRSPWNLWKKNRGVPSKGLCLKRSQIVWDILR